MVRLLLGALVAAVVMFGWGFFYWTMLAHRVDVLKPFEQDREAELFLALSKAANESGMYMHPYQREGEDDEVVAKRMEDGPVVMVSYGGGITTPMWQTLAAGFVHMLAVCFLAGALLKMVAWAHWSYLTRTGFVLIVGLVGALLIDASWIVWWHQDIKFHLFNAGFHVGAMLLAGLALAAFIKAKTPAPN
jgi:hypothetical protein